MKFPLHFFFCLGVFLQNTFAQSNFNFWIGDWDVYSIASGNCIGENHISKILDNNVIFENWNDVLGIKGKSFTLYDSISHQWKQTWVDNTGEITELTGILGSDTMIFISQPKFNRENRLVINRMTIVKKSENELLQTGEVSFDNTRTWQTNYSFKYKRQSNYSLTHKQFTMKLYGVKLKVSNLETALKFYHETLGFQIDKSNKTENEIQLYTNSYKIILQEDKAMKQESSQSLPSVSMCMAVKNIDSSFHALKSKGVKFFSDEKRKEGVGISMKIFDPFGNCISIMQLTYPNAPEITEPFIYNCGYYVASMDKARNFYKEILGFTELSEHYLPSDMPLGYADKSFAFMLHQNRPEFNHMLTPNMKLVFSVSDFTALKKLLAENKITFSQTNNIITITDNNGIQSDIILSTNNSIH